MTALNKTTGKLGDATGPRKTRFQEVMSKFDRKNQAKQLRQNKAKDHALALEVFRGKDGAPRNVAVIPLCADVDAAAAVQSLNKSLNIQAVVPEEGSIRVDIDRFKQKLSYIITRRDLFFALDAAKAADYVLLVLSADTEVDSQGDIILRAIESQGISNVYTAVQNLDKCDPPKRRAQIVTSLTSFITHFFPEQEKVFSLDSAQECQNVMRSLCTTTPRGIRWREDRSWLLVESVTFPSDAASDGTGSVTITGVTRGQKLKADRLIQVGDWGTFQISSITAAPIELARKGKEHHMAVDPTSATLDVPSETADTLDELAPEETVMETLQTIGAPSTRATDRKGVLLDDQHFYSDPEDEEELPGPKRIPRGTSKYQSAWYLGDMSDSGSDLTDVDEEMDDLPELAEAGPANGMEGVRPTAPATEAGMTEYAESEAPFADADAEQEATDLEAFRARRQRDAADDARFPDEIELPPNVLARERLARYRGLKSLRTSAWDPEEDKPHMPLEWPRLLDVADYRGAKSRVLRDALLGGIAPGTRVAIQLAHVPLALQRRYDAARPLAAFGLLPHEHKRTCLNFSLTLGADAAAPLKSKEELIVQVGPRRLAMRPLFSQGGTTPNDVHKFERWAQPGRTVVASCTGPLTWGSVPALFFRRRAGALELVGQGTALPPSTARVIAKRVVLTGEPYKIHRRVVNVRYMFFNAEDVAWFKALPLWTNHGRQGEIRESLGTHGYLKAVFDGKINMQEAVGVSLYKRVWPRAARAVTTLDDLEA